MVRRGGLLVLVAPGVGDVEAFTLKDETGSSRKKALGHLAAFRALRGGVVGHPLEPLELVPLGAPVFVRRHRQVVSGFAIDERVM